jgi:hypothetical protein
MRQVAMMVLKVEVEAETGEEERSSYYSCGDVHS